MIFAGILWGPAVKYNKEINDIFDKYSQPVFSFGLNLGEYYDDFVYDIYQNEDTAKWKIDKKVEHMRSSPNKDVKVVFFDIDTSKTYFHEKKGYSVFSNVEHMKEEVRSTYKDKIDDYFFDIIFHLTDNHKELDYTAEVLKDYIEKVEKRDGLDNSLSTSMVNFYKTLDVPKLPARFSERDERLNEFSDLEPEM